LKNVKTALSNPKQAISEKLNSDSRKTHSHEIPDKVKYLQELDDNFQAISKGYSKEVTTLQEYLASTQKNLTLLTSFQQRLENQEAFEIDTLSQLLNSSIKFEQSLNESRFHLHDQITGKCNIPLIDFSKKRPSYCL